MANCDFSLKSNLVGEGLKNSLTLDTDRCDVESHRIVEVPVRGPDPATTLAIVSGIAVAKIDAPDGRGAVPLELFILTDYKLDNRSQFVDAAAYAWLSDISDDEFKYFTAARIDAVEVHANVDGRVQIHVMASIENDMSLGRIGYQVFVLSSKPRPLLTPGRHLDLSTRVTPYPPARSFPESFLA